MFGLHIYSEKQALAKKLTLGAVTVSLCVVIVLAATGIVTRGEMIGCLAGLCLLSEYILLGFFRCYRVKRFRGHRIVRWLLLAALSIYIVSDLWLRLEQPVIANGLIPLPWFPILIVAVAQCVRNGYVSQNDN